MQLLTRVGRPALLVVTALAAACGEPTVIGPKNNGDNADAASNQAVDARKKTDAVFTLPEVAESEAGPPPLQMSTVVYAHSASALFTVNPDTFSITRIGGFRRAADGATITDVTDIAVDRKGDIVGVTFGELIRIQPKAGVAEVTTIGQLNGSSFNGLSWVVTAAGSELLLATASSGAVFKLDPTTGASSQIGILGGNLRSSGDIVSVAELGTFVTVKDGPIADTDQLAKMDPITGRATVIGPIGFPDVWGVGYWGKSVFGFTKGGDFILIDPKTGKGEMRASGEATWWGAGVTTQAKVTIFQ